jgi:hypothetical protein
LEGLRALNKYLTDDTEKLKINGGIVDATGMDGLPNEQEYEEESDEWYEQRARSSAIILLK